MTGAGTPFPPPDGDVTEAQQRHLRDTFGALLRDYRERAGLTQQELADRAGVDLATVGRFERGQRRPRLSTIEVIAAELADAAGPWLVDGPGGRVRRRGKQMRHLDDLQAKIKLARQLERRVERMAETAGPGEEGDQARRVLAALQADRANMLRPQRTHTRHRRRSEPGSVDN